MCGSTYKDTSKKVPIVVWHTNTSQWGQSSTTFQFSETYWNSAHQLGATKAVFSFPWEQELTRESRLFFSLIVTAGKPKEKSTFYGILATPLSQKWKCVKWEWDEHTEGARTNLLRMSYIAYIIFRSKSHHKFGEFLLQHTIVCQLLGPKLLIHSF